MPTPAAIRKQAKQADELHAKVYAVPDDTPSDAPDTSKAPVSTDDLDPKQVEGTPNVEAVVAEEAAPAPASTEPAEPAPAPAPTEDAGWEQKYKTLQGKYDAEVPRLNTEVKNLQAQLSSLHEVIASLKQPEPDPKPAAPEKPKLLKDEEISEYGADLIEVMRKAAREEFGGELEEVRAENARLKEQLGGVSNHAAETAQNIVYTTLDAQVPNWKELNGDQGFLAWLAENDIYAGSSRHLLLQQAFKEHDAARVVSFFKGYLNEHAAITPTGEETPTPATQERAPTVDMSQIAAPGKPRVGGGVSTQDGKRIWRQAEIKAFYADVRRGKYSHDPKTKASLEADIIAAGPEGRIVA